MELVLPACPTSSSGKLKLTCLGLGVLPWACTEKPGACFLIFSPWGTQQLCPCPCPRLHCLSHSPCHCHAFCLSGHLSPGPPTLFSPPGDHGPGSKRRTVQVHPSSALQAQVPESLSRHALDRKPGQEE